MKISWLIKRLERFMVNYGDMLVYVGDSHERLDFYNFKIIKEDDEYSKISNLSPSEELLIAASSVTGEERFGKGDFPPNFVGMSVRLCGDHKHAGLIGKIVELKNTPFGLKPLVKINDLDCRFIIMSPNEHLTPLTEEEFGYGEGKDK